MGKKKHRKSYISKGQRANVANFGDLRDECDKALDKIAAWRAGKNPWITLSTRERNRPYIKVKANDYYGNPKTAVANLFKGS